MSGLTQGFVHSGEAQTCFRAILHALSRPGEIAIIEGVAAPGLPRAAAAILLTLTDKSTSVALPEAAREWLLFHTGARIAAPEAADFVVTATRPGLADLRSGSDDEPEAGATLILTCETFKSGRWFRLSGPGIETDRRLLLPLDEIFLAEWGVQSLIAPRGVDILLCADREIIGLPRSLTIEAA